MVIPKDHVATAAEEVSLAELADEIVLHPLDDVLDWETLPGRPAVERPATTADAIELVAAGVGVLLVPQSLARLHHRKDLTYRPVPETPESRVALSWPQADEAPDLVEEFIGIVRGRTVNERPRPRGHPAAPHGQGQRKRRRASGRGGRRAGRRRPAQARGGQEALFGRPAGGQSGKRGKPRSQ
ncbi:hypothetical protein SBADM41S_10288 [Streptomyces badius]